MSLGWSGLPTLVHCRSQAASSCRFSVNVGNTRTGFGSRSGSTAIKISRDPMSIPAAFAFGEDTRRVRARKDGTEESMMDSYSLRDQFHWARILSLLLVWSIKNCCCEEAGNIFCRMLWLNPSDNQGVRFLVDDVAANVAWEKSQNR